MYNPKIKEMINENRLNKDYSIFINGRFTDDLSTEIRNNDYILIIYTVTGG